MTSRGVVGRKLETAASLGKLVTTMKGLASVRVHQHRRTMRALDASTHTLDLAARALLYLHPELAQSQPAVQSNSIIVVFGSDRGMCGAFSSGQAPGAMPVSRTPLRSDDSANAVPMAGGEGGRRCSRPERQ